MARQDYLDNEFPGIAPHTRKPPKQPIPPRSPLTANDTHLDTISTAPGRKPPQKLSRQPAGYSRKRTQPLTADAPQQLTAAPRNTAPKRTGTGNQPLASMQKLNAFKNSPAYDAPQQGASKRTLGQAYNQMGNSRRLGGDRATGNNNRPYSSLQGTPQSAAYGQYGELRNQQPETPIDILTGSRGPVRRDGNSYTDAPGAGGDLVGVKNYETDAQVRERRPDLYGPGTGRDAYGNSTVLTEKYRAETKAIQDEEAAKDRKRLYGRFMSQLNAPAGSAPEAPELPFGSTGDNAKRRSLTRQYQTEVGAYDSQNRAQNQQRQGAMQGLNYMANQDAAAASGALTGQQNAFDNELAARNYDFNIEKFAATFGLDQEKFMAQQEKAAKAGKMTSEGVINMSQSALQDALAADINGKIDPQAFVLQVQSAALGGGMMNRQTNEYFSPADIKDKAEKGGVSEDIYRQQLQQQGFLG